MNDRPLAWLAVFILVLTACSASNNTALITHQPPAKSPSASSAIIISPTPTPTVTFSFFDTQTSTPTSTQIPTYRVTLDAVGDIMLARTIGDQILEKGPQIIFAGVQSILDSADVRIGNLECAITDRDTPERKSFPLKAPLQAVQALSLSKFDLLSLANNHAMDYGFAGLMDTQAALGRYDIATVGAGPDESAAHTPVVIERNGLKLAFLAYADVSPENSGFDPRTWAATRSQPGIAWADPQQIKVDVATARLQSDLVIVMLHSGFEINSTVSDTQQAEAHAAIDAGAVLVVGSHPHLLQGIERYHGGLIAYSLGNFVFDQYKGIANATVILRVSLDRSGFTDFDYIPVLIEDGLPTVTSIENARGIETLVAPLNP